MVPTKHGRRIIEKRDNPFKANSAENHDFRGIFRYLGFRGIIGRREWNAK